MKLQSVETRIKNTIGCVKSLVGTLEHSLNMTDIIYTGNG